MQTTKVQISLRIRVVWSAPLLFAAKIVWYTCYISKVSRFQLASVAEQAGLNLTWSKISEDTFLRDVAHIIFSFDTLPLKKSCFWFPDHTCKTGADCEFLMYIAATKI